jgi:hypothetical protein
VVKRGPMIGRSSRDFVSPRAGLLQQEPTDMVESAQRRGAFQPPSPDPRIIDDAWISSSGSCRGAHPRRPRSTHPPVGVTSRFGIVRALRDGARWNPVGCSPLSLRATGDPHATPPAGARHEKRVIFFGLGRVQVPQRHPDISDEAGMFGAPDGTPVKGGGKLAIGQV